MLSELDLLKADLSAAESLIEKQNKIILALKSQIERLEEEKKSFRA